MPPTLSTRGQPTAAGALSHAAHRRSDLRQRFWMGQTSHQARAPTQRAAPASTRRPSIALGPAIRRHPSATAVRRCTWSQRSCAAAPRVRPRRFDLLVTTSRSRTISTTVVGGSISPTPQSRMHRACPPPSRPPPLGVHLDLLRGRRALERQQPAADRGQRQAPAGEPVQRRDRSSGDDVGGDGDRRRRLLGPRPRTTVTGRSGRAPPPPRPGRRYVVPAARPE